ncbi:hypothetical protein [Variovorax sp. dw_954]|uniref:hypothetical protein n=1 Tax=Variovorax sp. dw_954 TaxID=2720078 RepID=UPI001BD61D12|nr:hypothetical protein [Variovorax sp. dw_954]
MSRTDQILAHLPAGVKLTSSELGKLIGLSPSIARQWVLVQSRKGYIEQAIGNDWPPKYQATGRVPSAPKVTPNEGITQRALRVSPVSVWALGGRAA